MTILRDTEGAVNKTRLPAGLRPVLVTTKPEDFTLPAAFALCEVAGVRMVESPNRCKTFTNKLPDGGEFRIVGSLTWNFELKRLSAWIRSDATRDETTTLLVQAVREARKTAPIAGEFWFEFTAKGGFLALQLDVARPLSDYGDDLALVARVPEFAPESMSGALN
ncbi:hypothetical protein H9623_02810 [Oerskovia sp. Sa1BUA8]|uniref:Uncharacterized protein n=1 Tax=Oerskovia douganii TaxID=2762210 RepID=A0A9D5UEP6_9CELL|nr:hypothetical protein [Oerskovia douganii]MBE7699237.1 hypothetical protein [Oerskovia douganii]